MMAKISDQFAADISSANPKDTISKQFSDLLNAPQEQPQPQINDTPNNLGAGIGRQLGLTARAAITGATALPAIVGDALNVAYNSAIASPINSAYRNITGNSDNLLNKLPPVTSAIQMIEDKIGLPSPQNASERIIQDTASAMAGTGGGIQLGNVLASYSPQILGAIGRGLASSPAMQIGSTAGASSAASGAKESGLGTAGQIAASLLGGIGGATAANTASGLSRSIGNNIARRFAAPIPPEIARKKAETVLESGPFKAIAPSELDALRNQVATNIINSPNANPAMLARLQDFKNIGVDPTLAQITRNPLDYAKERNLRGIAGVGERLMQRFDQQNTTLQNRVYGLANTAENKYQAGGDLIKSLKSIDDAYSSNIRAAYDNARNSSGKDLRVPLTTVAQDYANILKDFGDKVPSGVRNNFNQYGLLSGKQNKSFSFSDAENLLKVINANRSNDPATNAALSALNKSVKNAILSADDQGGVFSVPRKMAAEYFKIQEKIPSLGAAINDSVSPDDFVKRFVIDGKTNDIKELANLLNKNDADSLLKIKAQIGSYLAKSAFGDNIAGDSQFAAKSYFNALNKLGNDKLKVIFSPEELNDIYTIGRVGSYINSFPNSAPVNTSNTASAIANILNSSVTKFPFIGNLVKDARTKAFVDKSLNVSPNKL